LEAGQTPRFIFPNGPYESRASVIEINKRYKDEFSTKNKNVNGVNRAHILREGALPHIKIGEIEIHGPVPEKGGSIEERSVFGPEGFQPETALSQLESFARRAYRRELTTEDQKQIALLFDQRIAQDATPRQAALDTLKMILCSPSFIYLSEITEEESRWLRPHDLAARLSYALWASTPDELLFESASSGKLTQESELVNQIERMVEDPRSDEFLRGFLDNWLNLRGIGNLPPPRQEARVYYAENLPESMKQEARLMFRHLLESNGPATDLLDCDYTFVDKKLAKHYDLPEQKTLRLADGFQKVSLSGNTQRGGVLGMAGVLTVSANGVDTSPVTRGVWVLENLLGITPPPPPDVVPALDANVSDAKTIRDKLAIHRSDEACSVCHRNIDPMGYALESFDPIGRWRTKYPKPDKKSDAPKVDPTGELPSGETYNDFASFKRILASTRQELFLRNLVEKLLTYAAGRHLERSDRYEVDEILERVKSNNYGLRSILIAVLTSEIVRSR
jgi:hypothetical protein